MNRLLFSLSLFVNITVLHDTAYSLNSGNNKAMNSCANTIA